jgi:glucose-6-phosphate 1-epimerase
MRKLMHGVWVTQLQTSNGATAVVADHGAHVLSWTPAGGEEALFLSAHSGYGHNDAIRGGVPVIFPQFAERGNGKRHGFARVCDWRLDFAGTVEEKAVARYVLTHQDVPDTGWPHQFRLGYEVALTDDQLQMSLSVHNPSDEHWQFNAALHTYLRVKDVAAVGLTGLHGLTYVDQTQNGTRAVQKDECLHIAGEIDRIYLDTDTSNKVTLQDMDHTVIVWQSGFSDIVVWNPGREKSTALTDLTPGSYSSFLCVEAAAVEHAIKLAPGASWQGVQILVAK